MKFFVGSVILLLILAYYAYRYSFRKDDLNVKHNKLIVIAFFAAAFLLRVVVSYYNFSKGYYGFQVDINSMRNLGQTLADNGLFSYYKTSGSDNYMPGYLAMSLVLTKIIDVFSGGSEGSFATLLLRMPSIIADCGIAYLAYRTAGKNGFRQLPALLVSLLAVFNPTLLIGSSVWGQYDSVFAFLLVLSFYLAYDRHDVASYVVYSLALLFRPQAVFFAPLILFVFIYSLVKNKDKRVINIAGFISAACVFFIGIAPFGTLTVFDRFAAYFNEYCYSSVNAYNFWTFIGQNWQEDKNTFMWGVYLIAAVIIAAVAILIRRREKASLFFAASFLLMGLCTLGVRMHERYMLPVVVFALFAYIVRPRIELLISFVAVTLVSFFNIFHVEFYSGNGTTAVVRTICIMTIAAFGYMIFTGVRLFFSEVTDEQDKQANALASADNDKFFDRIKADKTSFVHQQTIRKMGKKDYIAIAVIMAVYSVFAFIRLGDTEIPKTAYSFSSEGPVVINLGEEKHISEIWFYNGHKAWRDYTLAISSDNVEWEWIKTNDDTLYIDADYRWQKNEFDLTAQYIRIAAADKNTIDETLEIVIKDNGNILTPVNTIEFSNLFDEQDMAVDAKSFMNSTYWDEVYYTNTVYEMLNGKMWYENTHPHLGKEIMAIGVMIFGVNPFGWRFMPTLCGVIMLFAFYVLSLRLFKETKWAVLATSVFAADFMHFMQTRVATIDVYAVLFIIASYIFMHDYTQMNFYETPLRKTYKPLALCGLLMGCGIASKWIGVYSAMGLALIILIQFIYRYREYRLSLNALDKDFKKDQRFNIVKSFNSNLNKTILFCCAVFILVPLIIYALSYIPFNDGVEGRSLITKIIESQKFMFTYHSQLAETHYYASDWYQWPVIDHPLRYVNEQVTEDTVRVISLMGNPAIWWTGIPASLYMIYLWINERDRKALFLTIGYLAQYLPWVLVPRYTFIYHYFASVPFITIMIIYSIQRIVDKRPKLKWLPYAYCGLCIVLFLMFYPAMSGMEVPNYYIDHFLKWSDGWFI
ncbi:MAG: phospholipid carrier-dependent glycosyltransferase [Clostridiales bacterium]|nr:phospholipid carrier-dependent glycosyltransferase [Clostridiales bacterium]